MQFEPNRKSLQKHRPPQWFKNAKLGIFIHWGLYSVSAFATTEYGGIVDILKNHGFKFHYSHNPYAEWYQNSHRINEEPYRSYHKDKFGDKSYEDFAEDFNKEVEKWDPTEWAKLFKSIGARYAVLTTKHHDGFNLWPSKTKNPKKPGYHTKRNLVEELRDAVKKEGIKFGTYYSGGLDWTFETNAIIDTISMVANMPISQEYADYTDKQFLELIDEFKPDILWNDIGYPHKGKLYEMIAHYYNTVEDGVINDRWMQFHPALRLVNKTFFLKKIILWIALKVIAKTGAGNPQKHYFGDYFTPEYPPFYTLSKDKWESTRGIGKSFGWNRMETIEHYLTAEKLVHIFIDIVSKNGNLILNIGPKPNGEIPEIQLERLIALGKWLEKNGEGIFDTEPWIEAETTTTTAQQVRFTAKGDKLFAFILGIPETNSIEIKGLRLKDNSKITIIGENNALEWVQTDKNIKINIPTIDKNQITLSLCITPM